MLGISPNLMMGVINAQTNLGLARQNKAIANQTYLAGKTRERQGITDGELEIIEQGQAIQAKGKEMKQGTFEHLGNAMHNINNIDVDNQYESDECEDSCDETNQETQYARTASASTPRQSRIDIIV